VILGGTEPHYTPSKAYQAAQSGRPVLATLHPESAAPGFLQRALGDRFVELPTPGIPDAESAGVALRRFFQRLEAASQPPDAAALEGVSARTVARRLAEALDQAVGGGLPLSGAG